MASAIVFADAGVVGGDAVERDCRACASAVPLPSDFDKHLFLPRLIVFPH